MAESKSYTLTGALHIANYGKDWVVMLKNLGLVQWGRAMDENAKTYMGSRGMNGFFQGSLAHAGNSRQAHDRQNA